ncbi:MAG: uncharacterized protein K0R38_1282 [Polyangiaceae bacterium]|nr:uncharacterized protein [Polyangiaceae bacterium]
MPQYRPPTPFDSLPPILPYKKGLPVPPGYRVVDRTSGLVLGGGLTLLAGYAAGLGLAASQDFERGTGYVAIPVVGPWAAIGARSFSCRVPISINVDGATVQRELNKCVGQAFDEVTTVVFLTVDGLIQATGAVLFFVGLGSSYKELVREDLPKTAVTVLPEGGMALSVSGKF